MKYSLRKKYIRGTSLHCLCTEKYQFTLFKRKRERTRQGNLHNAGTRKLINYQEDAADHYSCINHDLISQSWKTITVKLIEIVGTNVSWRTNSSYKHGWTWLSAYRTPQCRRCGNYLSLVRSEQKQNSVNPELTRRQARTSHLSWPHTDQKARVKREICNCRWAVVNFYPTNNWGRPSLVVQNNTICLSFTIHGLAYT